MTPRKQVAHAGDEWVPPTQNNHAMFSPPGCKWKKASNRKLALLHLMEMQLRDDNLLPLPLSFGSVMEILALGDERDNTFNTRVFLYLVTLILLQKRYAASYCQCFLTVLSV